MPIHPPDQCQISNSLCEHYLHILYKDVKVNHQKNSINETYGEILYPGLSKIAANIRITQEDVLYDLGSGIGKAALQLFLTTPLKQVHGIEFLPYLHEMAIAALAKSKSEIPLFYQYNKHISFECADFLKTSIKEASIILLASPCFSPSILSQLAKRIDENLKTHTVLTLKPLPLDQFVFKKAIRIECSWDAALCYIYERK